MDQKNSKILERDLEQNNFDILPLNPQENVCYPFHNNVSTRILEKDNYVPKVPCLLSPIVSNPVGRI